MPRSTLAIAAVAALALTGCTDTNPQTDPPPSAATTQNMAESAPQTSDTASKNSDFAAPTATAGGTNSQGALIQAGRTALDAVPDSIVTSLDLDHTGTGWEVAVTTADGTEHEVQVSADGVSVLSGPTTEHDDADDKAEHVNRIKAAAVDYEAAASKALSVVPNGAVVELELDDENGTVVWEAEVHDSSNATYDVLIDAGSGELIQKKLND